MILQIQTTEISNNILKEPKFHDPGTFGGFGKRGHTHRHKKDSCFISIDWSEMNYAFF